jgi:PAS domain S-box-containing protein
VSENTDGIKDCQQQLQAMEAANITQADSGINSAIAKVSKFVEEVYTQQKNLERENEELRLAYANLEISTAHYIDLYDCAPVGYVTLTAEGIIAKINLAGAKLLGVDRKNTFQGFFDWFVADTYKDHWYRHCSLFKQQGGRHSCELPLRREDGTSFDAQIHGLYTEAGDADPELRLVFTDITERNQALSKDDNDLKFEFIDSPDGMWDWNISTGEVNYSKQWKAMLGFTESEITGDFKEWARRIHPDDQKVAMTYVQGYLSDVSQGYSNEHRLLCKDGSYKWILTRGIARIRSPDGGTVRMLGTHTDITLRKQAEINLNIGAKAFEAQAAGSIVTDADRVIVCVNLAFTRITGYSAEDAIGQKPSFLRSGRHNEEFYKTIWDIIDQEGYWQGELWDKHKNGKIFPVWQTIAAVNDVNLRVVNYVASFIDITAQKQAENILMKARERLENEIASTQEELEKNRNETAAVNATLGVLLQHRESDKAGTQIALSQEVEITVLPLLKKLKTASFGRIQTTKLISILENGIQLLVESYGRTANLSAAYHKLTPVEAQVASMIRQGLPTKTIATALNNSSGTVSIHRKHIRKKLGLDGKADNLHSYLKSLVE